MFVDLVSRRATASTFSVIAGLPFGQGASGVWG